MSRLVTIPPPRPSGDKFLAKNRQCLCPGSRVISEKFPNWLASLFLKNTEGNHSAAFFQRRISECKGAPRPRKFSLFVTGPTTEDSCAMLRFSLEVFVQHKFAAAIHKPRFPKCSVCNEAVEIRTSKTVEHGQAVHEECYVPTITHKVPLPAKRLGIVGVDMVRNGSN